MQKSTKNGLLFLVIALTLAGCLTHTKTSSNMSIRKIFMTNVDMFLRRTDARTYGRPESQILTPVNLNDGYGGNIFPPYELVMPYALVDSSQIPTGIPIGLGDGPTITEWMGNPYKYPAVVKAIPAGSIIYVDSIYTRKGYSWWSSSFFTFQYLLCTINGVKNIEMGNFVRRDNGKIILPMQIIDMFSIYLEDITENGR